MKTEWDYTALARAYLKRPDYSCEAIEQLFDLTGVEALDPVCDVGAGTAHLTLHLARRGFSVTAVEPNSAMRELGIDRTRCFDCVTWHAGTGESTGQKDGAFALVTFGSSFNVCDRQAALAEAARILRPSAWFACMWNHRDLDDPLQGEIEALIRSRVPGYGYGTRRQDQTAIIEASGLFSQVHRIEGGVTHTQSVSDCIEAWRSHATLQQQAGARFEGVVNEIARLLEAKTSGELRIPYTTRIWAAQLA